MDKPDRDDAQMKELFSAARRVDRETLPGYREVLDAGPALQRRAPRRRMLILGLATATASVALAVTLFTFVPEADPVSVIPPVDVTRLEPEPESTLVETDSGSQRALQSLGYVAAAEGDLDRGGNKISGDDVAAGPPPPPRPASLPPAPAPARAPASWPAPPPAPLLASSSAAAVVGALVQDSGKFSDEFVQDLPVSDRFYQNVLTVAPGVQDPDGDGDPNVQGSRTRDFNPVVGGVDNVKPTGKSMSLVNSDSIVEMEVIPGGAGVQFARAKGGLARLAMAQGIREFNDLERVQRADPIAEPAGSESYDQVDERDFVATLDEALSTFSIDVDTASYSNVRRYLSKGKLPPRDAVRIEELINYFDYDYPEPSRGEPFSTSIEVAGCPWNEEHRLVRIGIKGREVQRGENRGSNLVFLIDVSGSMGDANKLPLLKSAFAMLVDQLGARDQVAIVVYAGAAGLVLPSTPGTDRATILAALARLEAGGSTDGGSGLELAYKTASENFIRGGVNRVVLATDGDFNVGRTHRGDLLEEIQYGASKGVSLTALGFGMGNLKDGTLERLANKGDGNYFYIDTEREARKVLVDGLQGTLVTIAKDVKIQVEFNPAEVAAYRLIGYENRALAKQDFNDDRKDAGEIGSGHTVTALYEIIPAAVATSRATVDPLKYQSASDLSQDAGSGELLTVKVRYKEPEASDSLLLQFTARDGGLSFRKASDDFRFAASVAAFGMVLRESAHRGAADLDAITEMLTEGVGIDKHGHRSEFVSLLHQARTASRP